ncbi:DUF2156 domain-containing protein [Arcanobacterium haemolyticum]|nr:DUF2156 domain-containing protein [Arcanobacterium haemolyticum]
MTTKLENKRSRFTPVLANLKQALPTFRTAPISVVFCGLLLITGVLARIPFFQLALHESFAFTWDQLALGRIWTPFTALLIPGQFLAFFLEVVVVLFVLPKVEQRYGSTRLLVTFLGLGAVANLLGSALVEGLATLGEPWAINGYGLLIGDPSVGLVAALVAFLVPAPQVWRNRGLVLIGVYVGLMFGYSGQPNDISRALAYIFGLLVGRYTVLRHDESASHKPHMPHKIFAPGHEVRVAASSITAMLALGPIVALFSKVRLGPLLPSLVLLNNDSSRLDQLPCSVFKLGRQCTEWLTWGPEIRHHLTAIIQIVPMMILLLCAWALMRGRRSAVWVAVVLLVRNAIGTVITFVGPHASGAVDEFALPMERIELIVQLVFVVVVNVGAALWLIHSRGSFPIHAGRRGAVAAWGLAAFFVVVAASASVIVGHVMSGSFAHEPSAFELFVAGLSLPLPPSARVVLGVMLRPTTTMAGLAFRAIELALWVSIALLVWRLTSRGIGHTGPHQGELRERLRTGYGTNLSFMSTWPGNLLWQDQETGAIVAYRAVAGVALTLSEPFGAKDIDLMGVVARFHQFADSQGLKPAWYSVNADTFGEVAHQLGWQCVEVAQESFVNVQEWQTRGKSWQDVRTAISRAKRDGIESHWTRWTDLSMEIYAQVVELSQEWVSDHPLPEMGFTLGGLDQLQDPDVRLMLAIDSTNRVQAVLSWLPTWRDGEIVGWTLDFMRRHKESMPGIMEFLIAQSAVRMRDDGLEFMSLSGAPLVRGKSDDEPTLLDDLLAFLSTTLEPVYGFQSLHRFKEKFKPQMRSWIMVYPSALDLPAIGLAVTRSYLPHLSVGEAVRAVREMSAA